VISQEKKTLIAALASYDSLEKNWALAKVLKKGMEDDNFETLREFGFVFSGGTYKRLFEEYDKGTGAPEPLLDRLDPTGETRRRLIYECGVVCLPDVEQGGITILAHLITQRKISIVWPFYTPWTTHLLNPENLALLRLCDQWHVKYLMNMGSIEEWMRGEARLDVTRNVQDVRLSFDLIGGTPDQKMEVKPEKNITKGIWYFRDPKPEPPATLHDQKWNRVDERQIVPERLAEMRIALISHDEKKGRMVEFVTDYQDELGLFNRVMTTGTTGRLVQEAAPALDPTKIHRYNSGPKGGDIEIATEILYGNCDVVIFFVDPLHAHPHTEDIRVIFRACMTNEHVRLLSNEQQAREWMDRTVKRMV